MADLSDYRTLFGDDFGDIAKVFEEGIPDDLENLLVSVIDDIAFAAAGFQVAVNSAVAVRESAYLGKVPSIVPESIPTPGTSLSGSSII